MRCVRLRGGSSAGSCRYPVLEPRGRESVSGPAPRFPAAARAREPLARGSPAAHAQCAGASLVRSCGRHGWFTLPSLLAAFGRDGAAGRAGPVAAGGGRRSRGRAAGGAVSPREGGGREGRARAGPAPSSRVLAGASFSSATVLIGTWACWFSPLFFPHVSSPLSLILWI